MDSKTTTIRQAREVTPELVEAFARLLPQLSDTMTAPAAELLRRIVADKCAALFVAEHDGRTVGVLTLVWYDIPSGRKAWIEDVVVDEAARGLGAGRALVEAALEHAKTIGTTRIMLTSRKWRKAAHALYLKTGFKEVETTVFLFENDKI